MRLVRLPYLDYYYIMTPRQKENWFKEQADMVCNSIAFWEKKVADLSEESLGGYDEDDNLYLDADDTKAQELKYLISHLQFDMREMERLEKEYQTYVKTKGE